MGTIMTFSCYDRFYTETELDRYLNGQNEAQTVNLKRHSLPLNNYTQKKVCEINANKS